MGMMIRRNKEAKAAAEKAAATREYECGLPFMNVPEVTPDYGGGKGEAPKTLRRKPGKPKYNV